MTAQCTLNGKGIVALYAYSIDGSGLEPDQQCEFLKNCGSKARQFYQVPYAPDYGPIALRDTVDQLRWAATYLNGDTKPFEFILGLEGNEFVPMTNEIYDAISD